MTRWLRAHFRCWGHLPAVALLSAPLVAVLGACGGGGGVREADPASAGEQLYRSRGCNVCHTVSGRASIGPTWKGIYGEPVTLDDGTSVTVDDAYLERSIRDPGAQRVEGFSATMPSLDLNDAEVASLVAYIRSLR